MTKLKIRQYGFIPDIPKEEDYVHILGAAEEVIQPDGDWSAFLPDRETQIKKVETYNCTGFGTLNIIEVFMFRVFGIRFNGSDRALGIVSSTRPPGNSPGVVLDKVRHVGIISEEDLPFSENIDTVEKYYSPDPLPKKLLDKANDWVNHYLLTYRWVFFDGTPQEKMVKLKDALKFSPVGVSVFAWIERNGLYYKPVGADDTHWTVCYKVDAENRPHIFDSYDNTLKILEPFYDFGQARRIHIEKRNTEQELGILQKWLNLLFQWLGLIAKAPVSPLEAPTSPTDPPPTATLIPKEPEPPRKSRIREWALAIQEYEGYGTQWAFTITKNFNPGAIRSKNGSFLKFDTYQEGFNYLADYLTRAATGKHDAYKPKFTLSRFFEVYSPTEDNNNPLAYAEFVAKKLSVEINIQIKELA